MFARHLIDTLDFARNGGVLHEKVPVAEMPRLLSMLTSPEGEVEYSLSGWVGREDGHLLSLTANGVIRLRCQRCLESMEYPIRLESSLLLVVGEQDDFLSDDGSDQDSIPASADQDVVELLEDEILLALPFAPRHPEGACSAPKTAERQAADHPFAVLAGLKNK